MLPGGSLLHGFCSKKYSKDLKAIHGRKKKTALPQSLTFGTPVSCDPPAPHLQEIPTVEGCKSIVGKAIGFDVNQASRVIRTLSSISPSIYL